MSITPGGNQVCPKCGELLTPGTRLPADGTVLGVLTGQMPTGPVHECE